MPVARRTTRATAKGPTTANRTRGGVTVSTTGMSGRSSAPTAAITAATATANGTARFSATATRSDIARRSAASRATEETTAGIPRIPARGVPTDQQGPYPSRSGDYRNGGGYYTPAFDNGARDGYEKGQEDVRKRRSFDPLRHSWYRSGDRHYENRYGSREQYKDVYRQGFQQGYERGFREGRYNW